MSEIALPTVGVPPGLPFPGRLCSDERLARLASAGSERALAVLYERHHQALYRYCRSILRDHDDAQDALQSTMTRAFVALQASDRDLAVRPWLYAIAHNEAISILRKRRANDCLLDERLPSRVSVESTVDHRERLQTLVADLNALPVRQRAALLMRECNGLPVREIAQALSISTGTAKQTIFEARSSLHELAEGRTMECETVRRAISDADGRVLRARRIGSHLRSCAGCRDFRASIDARTADLRALAPPLPAAAATATLARALAPAGSGGGHAGGAAAASASALGNHASASLLVKGLAGAAVLAAASAGSIHLVRNPAKHEHTSAALASRPAVRPTTAARTNTTPGATPPTATPLPPATHAITAADATDAHAGRGHQALASTGVRSVASNPAPSAASPAGAETKTGPYHTHGGTPGRAGRESRNGQAPPREPKGSRSHRSSKPARPARKPRGSSREGRDRGSTGGNGHTPQGHQAPAGQQPAGGEKGNEVHQSTKAPGTPPEKQHSNSGK